MQKRMLLPCVVCLAFGVAGVARADDKAQAVINEAVKAKGGEEAVAKCKATSVKAKGVFYGLGDPINFTMEGCECYPDKNKQAVNAEVNGNPFKMTTVVNGDKGWRNTNGDTMDMEKEQIQDARNAGHTSMVANLVALKDCTLAYLGESKIENKDVEGVKVSCKDRPDVSLYFDKNTHLLVKSASKSKDMNGQEVNQETFYSDYKAVDGVQEPMKISIKHDGNKYIENEVLEIKHLEKPDDSAFAKP